MLKSCTTGTPPSSGTPAAIAPIAIFPDPRAAVRARAGLTLEAAARKARVSLPYLRQIERGTARASFPLAQRLACIYQCRMDLFLATRPKTGRIKSRRVAQIAQA